MLDKTVLIIEPATAGYDLLPTAKQLGCFVIVMTADEDERVIPAKYKKLIDQFIMVDTNKLSAMIDRLKVLVKKPDAVIPGFELYVETAAIIASYLGLPHLCISAAKALRNKWEMRQCLHRGGVRSPMCWKIQKVEDIDRYVEKFLFPVVIKPIDQSGSVHVSKINNLEDLKIAYQSMCAETWTEMNKGVGTVAIIESYIAGKEYSIEGYIDQHQVKIISITEKTTTPPPYFVEMRHIVSARLNNHKKKQITDYMQQVVHAMGVNLGVFHAEIKIDDKGPVLIEMAGRLAGDRICDLILLAKGIDLRVLMIYSHLNSQTLTLKNEGIRYAGIQYLTIDGATYHSVNGVDQVRQLPGFYDYQLFYQPDEPIPQLHSFIGRVGSCLFIADTYHDLTNRLNAVTDTIRFV